VETVCFETPANSATSRMVAGFGFVIDTINRR
jgi:hypothetical protein